MLFRTLLLLFLVAFSVSAESGTLESMLSPGPVIDGHKKYENDCNKCHEAFNKSGQRDLCNECHKEVKQDIAGKEGLHGKQKEDDCRECHADHKGRDFDAAAFDEEKFNHNETDFALRNAHANSKVKCKNCHTPTQKYREAKHECIDCHKKDDVHKATLGTKCADCHNDKSWKEVVFDHDKTDFKLNEKHRDVKCKDCHKNEDLKKTPSSCIECHKKDDKHKTKFGDKCQDCHNERVWKDILFKHDRDTKYLLNGAHINTKCTSCHTTALYKTKTPDKCNDCHKKDDDKKGHKGRYGAKCESCHKETKWKELVFDHDRDTKYRLLESHKTVKCDSCHSGKLYIDKTPKDCYACHKKDDEKKGHKGQYGEKCESCHRETKWKTIYFDHNRDTKYALEGKHEKVKCNDCHTGHLYKQKLSVDCIACHKKHDEHKGQLGNKCESCHVVSDWKKTRFDHELSKFPLLGKHKDAKCKKCHEKPTFKDAKIQCFACHEKEDKHKRTLTTKCELCHVASSWKSWRFDHDKDTEFKLEGKHKNVDCVGCHKKPVGNRVEVSKDCFTCHIHDDVHNGGFGKNCLRCHNQQDFKQITMR